MAADGQENLESEKYSEAFFKRTYARYFLAGLIILPVAFIGLTLMQLSAIPLWLAVILVWSLSYVWPVLYANFNSINSAGFTVHAANYVFFSLIVGTFGFVLAVYGALSYTRHQHTLSFPSGGLTLGLFLLFFFFYIFLSRFHDVNFQFHSFAEFYLDPFGLFYFPQYINFSLPTLALYCLLVAVAQMRAGNM